MQVCTEGFTTNDQIPSCELPIFASPRQVSRVTTTGDLSVRLLPGAKSLCSCELAFYVSPGQVPSCSHYGGLVPASSSQDQALFRIPVTSPLV